MATINYNLPTISGSSPVAIVDDYNGLANAVDAAIAAAFSAEKTRAMAAENELATGVSNATTAANNANVAATDASAAAANAQSTANTAVSTANTAASTAEAAAGNASSALNQIAALVAAVPTDKISTITPSGLTAADFEVWVAPDKKHFAMSGFFVANSAITTYAAIPGGSNLYGLKITDGAPFADAGLTSAEQLRVNGFMHADSDYDLDKTHEGGTNLAVGTDGNLYVFSVIATGSFAWPVHIQYFPYAVYDLAAFGTPR